MTFKVGQEVLCTHTCNSLYGCDPHITKGKTYLITDMSMPGNLGILDDNKDKHWIRDDWFTEITFHVGDWVKFTEESGLYLTEGKSYLIKKIMDNYFNLINDKGTPGWWYKGQFIKVDAPKEESRFSVGDSVICVNDVSKKDFSLPITQGKEYAIDKISLDGSQIHIINDERKGQFFFASRFDKEGLPNEGTTIHFSKKYNFILSVGSSKLEFQVDEFFLKTLLKQLDMLGTWEGQEGIVQLLHTPAVTLRIPRGDYKGYSVEVIGEK